MTDKKLQDAIQAKFENSMSDSERNARREFFGLVSLFFLLVIVAALI